jgi:folate-binding protein YgfZ
VRSGTPRVVAATGEQFVPQMVNLELVGGVNFQKGCYPGQEVVARSQYRGTLKRRGPPSRRERRALHLLAHLGAAAWQALAAVQGLQRDLAPRPPGPA